MHHHLYSHILLQITIVLLLMVMQCDLIHLKCLDTCVSICKLLQVLSVNNHPPSKVLNDYPEFWEAASWSAFVTAGPTQFIKTASSPLVNVGMAELSGVLLLIIHQINIVNKLLLTIWRIFLFWPNNVNSYFLSYLQYLNLFFFFSSKKGMHWLGPWSNICLNKQLCKFEERFKKILISTLIL